MDVVRKECLFIGGPKDGCRLLVEVGKPYHFLKESPGILPLGHSVDIATFDNIFYYPMKFTGGIKTFTVYVLDGITGDQVFQALITRYPVPLAL